MQQSKVDVPSGGEAGERPEKRNAPAVPLWRMLRQTFGVDLKWWVPCWGGGMVLAHFLRIGYVPSLSLGDLGVVLSAVALLGGLALFSLLAVLALPAWSIGFLVHQHLLPVPPRPRQGDAPRKGLKSNRSRTQLVLGKQGKRVFGSFWIFALAALISALYYTIFLGLEHWKFGSLVTYGVGVGLCIGSLPLALLLAFSEVDWVRRLGPFFRKRLGSLLLFLMIYQLFWPLAGVAVSYMAPPTRPLDWIYLFFAALMVVISHWGIYVTHRIEFSKRLRVFGSVMFMVILYSGSLLGTVDITVRKLGIGMLPGVQLQLTEQGCQIVKATWLEASCNPAQPGSNVYVLPSVDVLTRLGADFYVSPPGGISDEHKPRFLIPASQVLSWSRVEAVKKTAAVPAVAPSVK
ncbi:hypothetical protein [Xanthomonas tesorieronis]|uniref:hypothetical protein n=1 Tax=Xanthomonas tesorieronis TaxID=3160839 RepID=UPI0035120CDC